MEDKPTQSPDPMMNGETDRAQTIGPTVIQPSEGALGAAQTPNNPITTSTLSPAQPIPPQQTTEVSPPTPQQPLSPTNGSVLPKQKKKLPKLFLPVLLGVLLFMGAGAFAYVNVYQQQPEIIWKDSMRNTAKGLESFSAFDKTLSFDEGMAYKGGFSVEKPLAATGSIEGKVKGKNSESNGSVSISGAKVDFSVRTIAVADAEYPDIYGRVSGLESVSAFVGPQYAALIQQYDNKWFFVDHTLIAQAAQSATENAESAKNNLSLSEEDIKTIRDKYTAVINQYVFTTNESNSIMQRVGEASKEDFDGKPTVKYVVEVNKDNLKNFATALKDAAKDTKIEELIAPGDTSIDEVLQFQDLLQSIDRLDTSKAKVEVWADKNLRYIRNVRITPQESGSNASVDIGLNYSGGTEYPFYIRINGSDETSKGSVVLTMTINTDTKNTSLGVKANIDYTSDVDQDIALNATLEFAPNGDAVNPEKPGDATNILELLGNLQAGASTPLENLSDYPVPTDDWEL